MSKLSIRRPEDWAHLDATMVRFEVYESGGEDRYKVFVDNTLIDGFVRWSCAKKIADVLRVTLPYRI